MAKKLQLSTQFKTLIKDYIGTFVKCDTLSDEISSKGVHTLNGYVGDYDFILIFATGNGYNHRQVCNIYKYNLWSSTLQMLRLDTQHFENNLKIYSNKCDTSDCEYIGTGTYHISHIVGVKLS